MRRFRSFLTSTELSRRFRRPSSPVGACACDGGVRAGPVPTCCPTRSVSRSFEAPALQRTRLLGGTSATSKKMATSPMRFGPFRRSRRGDRYAGLPHPTPSVLRVSHSLNGLIPPSLVAIFTPLPPLGFWVAFRAFPTQSAVVLLRTRLLSCCQALPAGGFHLALASSEPCLAAGLTDLAQNLLGIGAASGLPALAGRKALRAFRFLPEAQQTLVHRVSRGQFERRRRLTSSRATISAPASEPCSDCASVLARRCSRTDEPMLSWPFASPRNAGSTTGRLPPPS